MTRAKEFLKYRWVAHQSTGIGMSGAATSTRHSFADALRAAKAEPEVRARLLAHSLGTITERYGRGHDVRALQEAVNAERYQVRGETA